MIKNILKKFLLVLLSFFLIYLLLFVFLIYPNDKRINMNDEIGLNTNSRGQLSFVKGSFKSLITHTLSEFEYEKVLNRFKTDFPYFNLISQSVRFINPYQVYLSVGTYPEYVEGRDAIYIPVSESINLKPQLKGDYVLNFSMLSFSEKATFKININDKVLYQEKIEKTLTPLNHLSFYYKYFYRYFFPEGKNENDSWKNFEIPLTLNQNDTLKIACLGETNGCFISEPSFWKESEHQKKNIIFILVDTLRYDALTSSSNLFMKDLAHSGTYFSNTLAAGNMTGPSTNGLLSCRTPSQIPHIAFSYATSIEKGENYYLEKKPSFPSYFSELGWQTAMIGNISIISSVINMGVDHGFKQQISFEKEGYETPLTTKEAIKWLKNNSHKPFFLYLHYNAPHPPYRAPLIDLIDVFPGWSNAFQSYSSILKWLYNAEVKFTDRYLKILFDAIKSMNLEKNTVVVLTGDHGQHQEIREFKENEIGKIYKGSFHDHGATLYNDEVKVPLVIKKLYNPKVNVISTFVSNLDIAPTLLDIANIKVPTYCFGKSLDPLLENPTLELHDNFINRSIPTEGFRARGAVIKNQFKFIKNYHPIEKKIFAPGSYLSENAKIFSTEEIYDLKADAFEKNNIRFKKPLIRSNLNLEFRKVFPLEQTFELILDLPNKEVATLTFDRIYENLNLSNATLVQNKLEVVVKDSLRYKIDARQLFDHPPEVKVNQKILPLYFTKLRLPIHPLSSDELPIEDQGDFQLLKSTKEPMLYLRKIEVDQIHERQINAHGNAQFEKILRDWGYLNDNADTAQK